MLKRIFSSIQDYLKRGETGDPEEVMTWPRQHLCYWAQGTLVLSHVF